MTARKEPPLPDKVKVGPLTYDVTDNVMTHTLAEHEAKSDLYGVTDHKRQTIVVNPGMAVGQYRATVLHEVLHAVIYVSGMPISDEENERIVRALETPLLGVLRDNPVLVAFLVGGSA